MSEFFFGDYGTLGDADSDRGMAILQQFHQAMQDLYGSSYTLSFSDLSSRYPAGDIEGLGFAANIVPMTDDATNSAMRALASAGGGKVPANYNGFISALSGQATSVNLWDELSYVASQSASDIASGAQKVGDTVLSTAGTTLNAVNFWQHAIWLIPIVVVWLAYKNREGLSSAVGARAIKAIKGE